MLAASCRAQGDLQPGHWSRSVTIPTYFAKLPAAQDDVAKWAADGAKLLMDGLNVQDVKGKDQAQILHQAMSSILGAELQQKRSLMRFVGRAEAVPADEVMDATVSAVIDAADANDKKWMQMLAIGAMAKSVRESADARTAGLTELNAIEKMFARME